MFTIYLPFYIVRRLALNLCNYQSEYKLTNCTHALQQSKDLVNIDFIHISTFDKKVLKNAELEFVKYYF
jgi:hypothetical protein